MLLEAESPLGITRSLPALKEAGVGPRRLALTTYRGSRNPRPSTDERIAWTEVLERLASHTIRDQKDGAAFSLVQLKPGTARANENVVAHSAVVLDIDDGTPLESITRQIKQYEFLAVSTHNNTRDHPKYRLIFPLSRDVSPAYWPQTWQLANQLIGGHADQSTKDPSRLYYFPSCPVEREKEAFRIHNLGEWLDPDEVGSPRAPSAAAATAIGCYNYPFIAGIKLPPDENRVCGDGERTVHLTSLIGHWIQDGLGLQECIACAQAWNARNDPPLEQGKVVRTCDSIWRTHHQHRDAPTAGEPTATFGAAPTVALAPLFDLETARINRFLDSEPQPRRWLLRNCLPCGKVGAIIAPGGTGKSQFMMQLAISIAAGVPLAGGAWLPAETGAVLALFAEDDREELHRRIHASVSAIGPAFLGTELRDRLSRNLFVRSMVAQSNLMTWVNPQGQVDRTDYAARLIETVKDVRDLKLIIIDPASRSRAGNENSAEDVTRFVEVVEFVSQQTGAAVVVVHHANKASMQGMEQNQAAARGSSAFTDGIRWQMNLAGLTKEEAKRLHVSDGDRYKYLTATMTKNNYAPPVPPVILVRGPGGYLTKAAIELSPERVSEKGSVEVLSRIETTPGYYSVRSFSERFGGREKDFRVGVNKLAALVNDALDNGLIEKSGDRRGTLRVTDKGRALLQVWRAPVR